MGLRNNRNLFNPLNRGLLCPAEMTEMTEIEDSCSSTLRKRHPTGCRAENWKLGWRDESFVFLARRAGFLLLLISVHEMRRLRLMLNDVNLFTGRQQQYQTVILKRLKSVKGFLWFFVFHPTVFVYRLQFTGYSLLFTVYRLPFNVYRLMFTV